MKLKALQNLTCVTLAIILLIYSFFNYSNRQFKYNRLSKNKYKVNFQPTIYKPFTFGLHRFISSFIWTESLLTLDTFRMKNNTKRSWFFHRIQSVIELNPHFIDAYRYGPVLLSVVVDDIFGADEIFQLGYEKYPNDSYIQYYYGFNSYFEIGDIKKGIFIFKKFVENKNIDSTKMISIKRIIAKGLVKIDRVDEGLSFLKEMYKFEKDEKIKKSLLELINKITKEND